MKKIGIAIAGCLFMLGGCTSRNATEEQTEATSESEVTYEKDVVCSKFMEREGRTNSQQGFEITGDYIFSCEHGGHVNVYNFKTANPQPLAEFNLASSRPDNHVNNVEFGVETKEGASFPLLYITNGQVGSEIEWTCFVESITQDGENFSSEIAQTIELDGSKWEEKGYIPIFGAPSWMVDCERGFLWIFGAYKRTLYETTKYAWENRYMATKFRLPKLAEGECVKLGADDILEQVVFPYDVWITQAGCMRDGKIYFSFGYGHHTNEKKSGTYLQVYDTDTKTISLRYNLSEQVPQEPEDVEVHDGYIYLNTNSPFIYKISMKE